MRWWKRLTAWFTSPEYMTREQQIDEAVDCGCVDCRKWLAEHAPDRAPRSAT